MRPCRKILDRQGDQLDQSRWPLARDVRVYVLVQQLVGIQLRRVGRQVEQLQAPMVLKPQLDGGRLVKRSVVDDQEDLALGEVRQQLVPRVSQFIVRRLPMLAGLPLFARVWARTPDLGEIGRR